MQSVRDAIRQVRPPPTPAQREYLALLVRREARRLRRAWILPALDCEALPPDLRPRGRWWARWLARRRRRRVLLTLEVLSEADFGRAEAGSTIRILRETGAAGLLGP